MTSVRFRIHYHRRAAPQVLIAAALLFVLSLTRARASVPAPQALSSVAPGVRQFYVTRTLFKPTEAPTACAEGYHFASIWEIADPSALQYNTDLGLTGSDNGAGPPSALNIFGTRLVWGWMRTGYSTYASEPAGKANCTAWASDYSFDWGSVAVLPSNWTAGSQDVGVWEVEVRTCNASQWVWCVQDDASSGWRVFLPLVLR